MTNNDGNGKGKTETNTKHMRKGGDKQMKNRSNNRRKALLREKINRRKELQYQKLQARGEMAFAELFEVPFVECSEGRGLQLLPNGLKVLVMTKPTEDAPLAITEEDLALNPDLVAIMTGKGRRFKFLGMICAHYLKASCRKSNGEYAFPEPESLPCDNCFWEEGKGGHCIKKAERHQRGLERQVQDVALEAAAGDLSNGPNKGTQMGYIDGSDDLETKDLVDGTYRNLKRLSMSNEKLLDEVIPFVEKLFCSDEEGYMPRIVFPEISEIGSTKPAVVGLLNGDKGSFGFAVGAMMKKLRVSRALLVIEGWSLATDVENPFHIPIEDHTMREACYLANLLTPSGCIGGALWPIRKSGDKRILGKPSLELRMTEWDQDIQTAFQATRPLPVNRDESDGIYGSLN